MASKFILGSTQPFLLYVNSKNRSNQNSPSTLFNIQLAFPPLHIKRVTLLQAIIPNTLYTFRNDKFVVNNNFDFIDSTGLPVTAVITPGSYDTADFITEFNTQLAAVSPDTYTITYNPNTLRLTITSSSALFQILGATGPNTLHNILPFIGFNEVDTAAGTVQLAPKPINLGSPKEVFIKIGNFQAQIHNTVPKFSAMWQISMSVPFGEILFYEQLNTHESGIEVDQRSMNQLDIQMVDDNGDTLILDTDWSCLVRFD